MNMPEAKAVLYDVFKVKLLTHDCKEYSAAEWNVFQQKEGISYKTGVFKPGSMTAHVLVEPFVPQWVIHEHVSHRVFFEKSLVGKSICRAEQELGLLESLMYASGDRVECVADSDVIGFEALHHNGTVIIRHNPHDALVNAYLQSIRRLDAFNHKNLGFIEGFADWMTRLLANRLGVPYESDCVVSDVFRELISLEQSRGPFTAYYTAGMDKNHEDDAVLKLFMENMGKFAEGIMLLIKYGSDKPQSDIDCLCIVSDEIKEGIEAVRLPNFLDICFSSWKNFERGLRNNDVHYSIPLLSGRVLINKDAFADSAMRALASTSDDIITYTRSKKMEALALADECFSAYARTRSPVNLYRAMINLSYAATYHTEIEDGLFHERKDQEYLNRLLNMSSQSQLAKARHNVKFMHNSRLPQIESSFREIRKSLY